MRLPIDSGFINAYNDFKCIGFIRREKGKDVFFSIDDLNPDIDIDSIKLGLELTFELIKTPKGPRAKNINLLK
ncbi:retron Se72 family effector protein [Photobacterium leiognathi]|uniref:retron Se72 family effector protein n=1 Tax=Photobacterium leiognathi TaxID=553611 RepID=UPI002980AA80|nr:retron Se72 family effector protein [Photobacterium leiognathi]